MERLTVHVIPNASRSEVISKEGKTWKVRLAAPPVDGKANQALLRLIADEIDCAPSELSIYKGSNSKTKIVNLPFAI